MSTTSAYSPARAAADYYTGVYDFLHEFLVQDTAFYRSTLDPARDSVLELGCGTGRVLLPLVEAGLPTVGLDISESMLAIAREKLHGRTTAAPWELVCGDMRRYDLGRRFGAILIPFNTFLYMHTPEDRAACLSTACAHLADDGVLIIDVFNPAWVLKSRPAGALYQEMVRYRPDTQATFFYFSSYSAAGGLIYWHQIFDEAGSDAVCRRWYRMMKLAHLTEEQLRQAAAEAGFEAQSVFGWYDRRPATPESNNLILVLRKPGGRRDW